MSNNNINYVNVAASTGMSENYNLKWPVSHPTEHVMTLVSDEFGNITFDNQLYTYSNVKVVSKTPLTGQFTTIEDAMLACDTPTTDNRYLIIIEPGIYEENLLEVPNYVYISGKLTLETVTVKPIGNHDLFHIYEGTSIYNLTIMDCLQYAIKCVDTGDFGAIIHKVSMQNCNYGIYFESITQVNNVYLEYVDIDAQRTAINLIASPTYDNLCSVENFYTYLYNTSSESLIIIGNNCIFDGQGGHIEGLDQDRHCIDIRGTNVSVDCQALNISNFNHGIHCDVGSSGNIYFTGSSFHDNIMNIHILSDNITGYFFGTIARPLVSIPDICPFYLYNTDPKVIKVSKKGGDFDSINNAIEFITDASESQQYIIKVGPGLYIESQIITKDYVHIIGEYGGTFIQTSETLKHAFVINTQTNIQYINFIGPLTTYSVISCTGSNDNKKGSFYSCFFQNCNNILLQTVVDGQSKLLFRNCYISSNLINGFVIQSNNINAAKIEIDILSLNGYALTGNLIDASGEKTEIIVNNAFCNSSTQTGKFISISNGSDIILSNCKVINVNTAIYVPNSGLGPKLNIISCIFKNCISNVNIGNSLATGFINVSCEKDLITSNSTDVAFNILDPDGELMLIGDLYIGNKLTEVTNTSPAIKYGTNIGLLSGGTITSSGLNITISEGKGYIYTGSIPTDILRYLTWIQQTTTVADNSFTYLYIDSTGTLQSNISKPNTFNNCLIGSIYTLSGNVLWIQDTENQSTYTTTLIDNTLRNALGPIFSYGGICSEGSNMKLNITSGSYFYSTHNYILSSATNISNHMFYRNGSGGFSHVLSDTLLAKYDNNSGTLQNIGLNTYVKHNLYINVDSAGTNTYLLVYGQEIFSSLADARVGNNPLAPTFFKDTIVSVSGIIVHKSLIGLDSLSDFIDIRPTVSFRSQGSTVTADHNSLSNLTVGDVHTQYFRNDGTHTMSSDLNIGGFDLINTGLLRNVGNTDNINPFLHGSRHLPGAADPLTVGVPVSIGTSNSEGIVNNFARSDHVHDHGTQTLGTLHAAVTQTVNGFMSSVDKIKLDNATSSDIINTISLRDANGGFSNKYLTITGTTDSTSISTGSLTSLGGIGIAKNGYFGGRLYIAQSSMSGTPIGGNLLRVNNTTFTDTNTIQNGTLGIWYGSVFSSPTIAASNTGVTTSMAINIFISGAPIAGTNETFINSYALFVNTGTSFFGGRCLLNGNNLSASPSGAGDFVNIAGNSFTDSSTVSSGTLSSWYGTYIGAPTLAASNTGVITSNASTLYIQGSPVAGTNETITNSYALNVNSGIVRFGDITSSTSSLIGSVVLSGGLSISNTTNSVSITNGGALTIAGGLAIAKDLYSSGLSYFKNTTNSTAINTGSVQLLGGLSVVKDFYHSGLHYSTNTINATAINTGSVQLLGGLSVVKDFYQSGSYINTNTTDSSAVGTGPVQLSGGLSVAKKFYLGSDLTMNGYLWCYGLAKFQNTDESTSISTGAITTLGGVGISKNLYVGGKINVAGQTQIAGDVVIGSNSLTPNSTLDVQGSLSNKVTITSSNLVLSDSHRYVNVDTTAGNVSITLPDATGIIGRTYYIIKSSTDAYNVIISCYGTQTINSIPTYSLGTQYDGLKIYTDGSNWFSVAAVSLISKTLGTQIYGLGEDGNVTIPSGTTTLTRDTYYQNLTIASGGNLVTDGWRVFVAGLLTLTDTTSSINCNGGSASGITGGTAVNVTILAPASTLGGSGNGANGRNTSGNGTTPGGFAAGSSGIGATGGRGGNSSGATGANPPSYVNPNDRYGGVRLLDTLPGAILGKSSDYWTANGAEYVHGGLGGGSGACTAGNSSSRYSGGSGAGGGCVIVGARYITGSGSISANGGNGGNASVTGGTTGSCAGGAGGGGGFVVIFTSSDFSTLPTTITANGGLPGNGAGVNYTAATAGGNGRVIKLQF